jgi:hypothetical protein
MEVAVAEVWKNSVDLFSKERCEIRIGSGACIVWGYFAFYLAHCVRVQM